MSDIKDMISNYASSLFGGSNDARQYALVTATFWLSQSIFQRLAGSLKIHSGRSGLLMYGYGALSTLACSKLAFDANEYSNAYFGDGSKTKSKFSVSTLFESPKDTYRKNLVRSMLLTTGSYLLLERKLFATAIPSSVISLGVFANGLRGSVEATGPVATEDQRRQIQKLGKLHGCHHCNSRQLLTKSNFIADHMPPTKDTLIMNKSFFRRFFNIKVKQRLWPQCQSCFSLQGAAVRAGEHVPIYHWKLRQCHIAPAAALFMSNNEHVRNLVDPIVDSICAGISECEAKCSKIYDIIFPR